MSQLPLDMDRSLHPEIRDRTFILQGEHVHASIHKVSQILTVRRFGLKLNGFCPGSGFGIKAGQGGGVHTYIQNGIDIFSV